MRILAIETSCDETAVAVVECEGGLASPTFRVLSHELYSQASRHAEFGGVYPSLAKRLHNQNFTPLLIQALQKADLEREASTPLSEDQIGSVKAVLEREPELFKALTTYLAHTKKPDIDAIAVTKGPGLEPALWVGVNAARALALIWSIPLIPADHMKGHIFSVLSEKEESLTSHFQFPILSLLVSGGHTQLVLVKDWGTFEIVGETRDDAVGEAFDKVARLLDLPYPGGPHISRLAEEEREQNEVADIDLPRPMLNSDDLDFSYSGLKTAVLYKIKSEGSLNEDRKAAYARAFEDAAIEVLIKKTQRAIERYHPATLIIAGGVAANKYLRSQAEPLVTEHGIPLYIPDLTLTGDNAVMIATAAYIEFLTNEKSSFQNYDIRANSNLRVER